MMEIHPRATATVVFGLVLAVLGLASPSDGAGGREKWNRKIAGAEGFLTVGEWKRAQQAAEDAGTYILDSSLPNTDNAAELAAVCRIRAVAYASMDQERLASWYWQVGQILDPDFPVTDYLSSYPQAAFLNDLKPRSSGGPASRLPEVLADGLEEPILKRGSDPHYSASCKAAGFQSSATVEVVVGADGFVSDPLLIDGSDRPVFSYATMATLGHWQFKPVSDNVDLGSFRYAITIRYRLK